MDVSLGNNINYHNISNKGKIIKSNSINSNYDINPKLANNTKEIYERKNLLLMNTENNILKQSTNNIQIPKDSYQINQRNINKKTIKSNCSEINIYKRNQSNNKKNIKIIIDKKKDNESNEIKSNKNETKKINLSNNSNCNTFHTINSNSNTNSNNSYKKENENVNKTGPLKMKNENNNNNNIDNNNTNTNKRQNKNIVNKKEGEDNLIKNELIKSECKEKIENNNKCSKTNIRAYYQQANADLLTKKMNIINNNKTKKINDNKKDKYNTQSDLNKMINEINIENSKDKEEINNNKNNDNLKRSIKINKNEHNKIKEILINDNPNNKIIGMPFSKKLRDKTSPLKDIRFINKVKTDIGTLSNYKNKPNKGFTNNNNNIIVSPKNNDKKKNYNDNHQEKPKKKININTNDNDNITPKSHNVINNKNINFGHIAKNSSISKHFSGSSSRKKIINNNERIISVNDNKNKNDNYINGNQYMKNINKGRILINSNNISKSNNRLSIKTEENNTLKLTQLNYMRNFEYDYNKNNINTFSQNENDTYTKNNEIYISPDKYLETRKKKNNNIDKENKLLSSSKNIKISINNKKGNKKLEYFTQEEKIEKIDNNTFNNSNQLYNDLNMEYTYKSSIFSGTGNFSDNKKVENCMTRFNKNVSNYSKASNYDDNYVEVEQYNNSDRYIEKPEKKTGTDIRTKLIKKEEFKDDYKNAYSPAINSIKCNNVNDNKKNNNNIIPDGKINKNYNNINNKKDMCIFGNKSIKTPVNKANNYIKNNINNNIIYNKNTNLYLMNDLNDNDNENMDNSLDSYQKKEMTYKFNHQNTIYKKRSPNESKININNNQNNIDGNNINIQKISKQFSNSPIIQNISINNIYDFDIPHQNCSKTFLRNNIKNNIANPNDVNNINNFYNCNNSNYNVSTPLSGDKILSERYLKEKENNNGNKKEHMNNFKNFMYRNDINNNKFLNKSNDIYEIRKNQMRSPRIYQKKFDHKNRPFFLQKENNNKPNIISNNSYNTKNKIYINEVDNHQDLDNISTKQNEFKKEIREIYNQQKKQKNIIECRRVNNFELSGIKKSNLIKPPIIIDENKNENIISHDNSNISNIDKKKIK